MPQQLMHRRPVIFGEVLFDEFADGTRTLGGAPFNVAWNLHAFRANPLFISRTGADEMGEQIRQAIAAHGMDMAGLQQDPEHATGLVRVSLFDGEPSYDIVADRAFDYIAANELPSIDKHNIGLVYHGTLALRGAASREALDRLIRRTKPPVFVDVNLRRPWYQPETVLNLLKQSHWCKINEAELLELADEDAGLGSDAVAGHLVGQLSNSLFVTRGAQGAIAVRNNGERFAVRPDIGTNVVDTVGAGDAFCSVLILGLLREWDFDTILSRAQDFASAVVGIHGAVTTDETFYEQFVRDWGACSG